MQTLPIGTVYLTPGAWTLHVFGGPAGVAAATGINRKTCQSWSRVVRTLGRFTCADLMEAAQELGLDLTVTDLVFGRYLLPTGATVSGQERMLAPIAGMPPALPHPRKSNRRTRARRAQPIGV